MIIILLTIIAVGVLLLSNRGAKLLRIACEAAVLLGLICLLMLLIYTIDSHAPIETIGLFWVIAGIVGLYFRHRP